MYVLSVARVGLCRKLGITEFEFQDQGWQSPSQFLETWPDLADGNPLLRARFLLPVLFRDSRCGSPKA